MKALPVGGYERRGFSWNRNRKESFAQSPIPYYTKMFCKEYKAINVAVPINLVVMETWRLLIEAMQYLVDIAKQRETDR